MRVFYVAFLICLSSCQYGDPLLTPPVCGDGVVQFIPDVYNEDCDTGDANSDLPDAESGCRSDCRPARCGDGIVDKLRGEECDAGPSGGYYCTTDCRIDYSPVCGNGVVEEDEECDDGNDNDADACLNNCIRNVCGDGYGWIGREQCDDGNTISGDGCSSQCRLEIPE
jgi:cysteine-rich repeat protein